MPDSTSPLFTAVDDVRRYPPLAGQHEAEVVVIGGGIAGVMTAWRLAQLGKKVILLEQNNLATGDTGFTTSFITRVPDTSLAPLAKKYGLDFIRQLFQATTEAQQYLEQTILAEQIDCDFVSSSSYYCSDTPSDVQLKAEWNVIQLVDQRANFVTSETDAKIRWPLAEAVRFDGEGWFNVRKFIVALLQRPGAKNIQVFEGTAVTGLDVTKDSVHVVCATGRVQCQSVVICAGPPPVFMAEVRPAIKHMETFVIAAEYPNAPLPPHLFWDTDQPYHYWRRLDEHTIIFGGADRSDEQRGGPDSHQQLEQDLAKKYPGMKAVTHRWSGSLFETSDGLPYIAAHPHYHHRVFVATGFAGNGMVMGTMAGQILASLASGQPHPASRLFDWSRTGLRIAKPGHQGQSASSGKNLTTWRTILALIGVLALVMPAVVFFMHRSAALWNNISSFQAFSAAIFPLFGLYAFTLVWLQIMIGSNMDLVRRFFPSLEKYHRVEGLFVFLFAWTHPLLLLVGYGWPPLFPPTFVAPHLVPFVYLGYFQLFLIDMTVITALLRKTRWLRKYWHKIHILNYVTFFSIWFHSWFLGTDVRSTSLRYFWIAYLMAVVTSIVLRLMRRQSKKEKSLTPMNTISAPAPAGEYTKVADVNQVTEGHPFCAHVGGLDIMVIKFGEKFYALNNTCSHEGGPLCEGTQNGQTIQCPWHGSIFDVTTGAVKQGPAKTAQKSYPVRVSGNAIEIKV